MNRDLAVGLHIVGFLTARQGQPLTSEVLAETYGTSPVVVRRVSAKLCRAGLIETRRGIGGGSLLTRDPSKINLRQVYEAIADRPELLGRHPGEESGAAKVLAEYINEIYDEAEEALMRKLESVTVKQMDAVVKPRICAWLSRNRK
ncbi:MAG: Rrf2 family transcriptional regulator [Planctomycetota bacterium]